MHKRLHSSYKNFGTDIQGHAKCLNMQNGSDGASSSLISGESLENFNNCPWNVDYSFKNWLWNNLKDGKLSRTCAICSSCSTNKFCIFWQNMDRIVLEEKRWSENLSSFLCNWAGGWHSTQTCRPLVNDSNANWSLQFRFVQPISYRMQ